MNERMREFFIAEMKSTWPDPATRPSLRQHGSGADQGFAIAGVQSRWMTFQAGWKACMSAMPKNTPHVAEYVVYAGHRRYFCVTQEGEKLLPGRYKFQLSD